MAKKNVRVNGTDNDNGEKKVRGKRKPTVYEFAKIDAEGKQTLVDLSLTHQESAKLVQAYLNKQLEEDGTDERYVLRKFQLFQ